MDDLLHELGGNVTYQDLYKLHTGHGMYGCSDDSDSSSESGISKYDHLKPPPYTYEELTQNLPADDLPLPSKLKPESNNGTIYGCQSSVQSLPSRAEDIAIKTSPKIKKKLTPKNKKSFNKSDAVQEKLSKSITIEHCFICDKPGQKHYKQKSHYENVIKWLELQIKELMEPVDINLFYCVICNLPLSGNEKAKHHYREKAHEEKAKSFCIPCLRVIEATDMPSHCTSKKHVGNVQSGPPHKSESKENNENFSISVKSEIKTPNGNLQNIKEMRIPNFSGPLRDVHQKNKSIHNKSYASALKGNSAQRTKVYSHTLEIIESEPTSARTEENKSRSHAKVLDGGCNFKHDFENEPILCNPFAVMLMDQLRRNYCQLCGEPVHKDKGNHYKKKQHYKALKDWIEYHGAFFGYNMNNIESVFCFACHFIFANLAAAKKHYISKEHERISNHYCDVCMIHDNSDVHKNHKKVRDLDRKPDDQQGSNPNATSNGSDIPEPEPEIFLKCTIKYMLSENYCHICQAKNHDEHYFTEKHIRRFRNWLVMMISTSKINLPPELIFCETCNLGLLGTDESASHYDSKKHLLNQLTYCSPCIFRASPNELIRHRKSSSHHENLKEILGQNMPTTETAIKPTNRGLKTNSEHDLGVLVSRKLKEMLTETYCLICNREKLNNHYFTKEHIENLRKWLDVMIKNTGVRLNLQLIFCEECCMTLSGTEESLNHYKTQEHLDNQLTYCYICILRGSPNEVIQHHHTDEHHKNLRSFLFPYLNENHSNASTDEGPSSDPTVNAESDELELEEDLTTEPNLHPTNDDIIKTSASCTDNKSITRLHLGLALSQYSTENSVTESKEHKLREDILKEYMEMVTMLERVPVEGYLNCLKEINKEIDVICKKHINNFDESKLESEGQNINQNKIVTSGIMENILAELGEENNDQIIQQNEIVNCTDCINNILDEEKEEEGSKVINRESDDNQIDQNNQQDQIVENTMIMKNIILDKLEDEGISCNTDNQNDESILQKKIVDCSSILDDRKAETEPKRHDHAHDYQNSQQQVDCTNLVQSNIVEELQIESEVIKKNASNQNDQDIHQTKFAEKICIRRNHILDDYGVEIEVLKKENVNFKNNMFDKHQVKSTVISRDADNENGVEKTNRNLENINLKMAKLKSILTNSLKQICSFSAIKEIRYLVMLIRNFKTALEIMKSEEECLKFDNVFQLAVRNYPSELNVEEESLDAFKYEVYKFTLDWEVEQLNTFINSQRELSSGVVLDCISEFSKKLLQEEKKYVIADQKWNDHFLNTKFDECLDDNVIKTQTDTATVTDAVKIGTNNSVGVNKLNELIETESSSSNDLVMEKNSDISFENAFECVCEGWCIQTIKINFL